MAGFFVGKGVKMKNYDWKYDYERKKEKAYYKEQKSQGFRCSHCKQFVLINDFMGTAHRNHCNYCLWSKHVDLDKPGDRKARCHSGMKPIGLTFKNEEYDKYGNIRKGEIKIIHFCVSDYIISTNRIAADDNTNEIFKTLDSSLHLDKKIKTQLQVEGLRLLSKNDREEINRQLFGKI